MTRRNRLITAVVIAVILVGGFTVSRLTTQEDSNRPTATVTRATLEQNVTITGKTKAVDRVDLAFERSGKITYTAPVGTRVRAGQTLATLDVGEIGAQIRQAQSSLLSATAQRNNYIAALEIQKQKLSELKSGVRPEELLVKETEIQKAEKDVALSYDNALNTLTDAHAKADNALVSTIGALFSGSAGNYALTYNTCDVQAKTDAEFQRSAADRVINEWSASNAALSGQSDAQRDAALTKAISDLQIIKSMMDRARATLLVECAMNDSSLTTYRANISTAITAIVTVQSSIKSLQQTITSQKFTVQRLKNELALKNAGAVEQQLRAQEAAVKQAESSLAAHEGQIGSAQATVQLYQAQAGKFTVRAPFNGIVTNVGFRRGELASSAKPAITLMGQDAMEIEAFIPEIDVAKVTAGQTITANIDAIPGETIPGTIVYIDPAETIVDGVVSYKIRIMPTKKDARIKSGLTANVTVSVLKKENVLTVPNYAVTETDGGAMVERVNADGKSQPLPVQIGARGTNGLIEIIKGLNEGDIVIATGLKPAKP